MMACQLLSEITYLLRDPPQCYNPYLPFISPNSTTQNTPRVSNINAPTDSSGSHGEHDDTVTRNVDYSRSSAGSLEPGSVHSRNNSLEVPRNLLIPSDQGSDTSGGEEIHRKPVTLDTPALAETPMTPSPRLPTNLAILPPTTPDTLPSIVIASPTTQRRLSLVTKRRISMPQRQNVNLKPQSQSGSFDKQSNTPTSPTSYIHRKLSTFKDSFRRVRSVAMKGSSRKSAVTKLSSPLLNQRKSISTPMSHASSHKSLCDDALCNDLPWINVVIKLYRLDMLQRQDGTLLPSYKICCAELVGALCRLYTLPSRTATDGNDGTDKLNSLLSPDSAYNMSRKEKAFSFSSSSSFGSSGTFSRFSRTSINFGFFGRRLSLLTTHRDTATLQENTVTTSSPSKSIIYDELCDDIEEALEKHATMLQNKRIKDNDDKRIEYLNKEVKGLLHTPFTILQLSIATNLIDTTKTANLRDVCWHLLLDTNQELVQSAGKLSL